MRRAGAPDSRWPQWWSPWQTRRSCTCPAPARPRAAGAPPRSRRTVARSPSAPPRPPSSPALPCTACPARQGRQTRAWLIALLAYHTMVFIKREDTCIAMLRTCTGCWCYLPQCSWQSRKGILQASNVFMLSLERVSGEAAPHLNADRHARKGSQCCPAAVSQGVVQVCRAASRRVVRHSDEALYRRLALVQSC